MHPNEKNAADAAAVLAKPKWVENWKKVQFREGVLFASYQSFFKNFLNGVVPNGPME